ncbi:MAG: hypothetical protein ACXADY_15340 [Candidatus Hodarchaeales archaeon]
MVNTEKVRRVFLRTLSFRNFVLSSLCVNFLFLGYLFLTRGFCIELSFLDGLLQYLFTGSLTYIMFFGLPLLVAFFIHLSRLSEPVSWWDLSRIPENSSLYDAIMLPIVQYGPIKIILPVIDEEAVIERLND